MKKAAILEYINKKKGDNPVHVNPTNLIWLSNQVGNITISPKADGVYKQIKIDNNIFISEYVQELDIYLVFDTLSYPYKHNNTVVNRMNWIRNIHPSTKTTYISAIKDQTEFINILNKDLNLLHIYIQTSNDKIKWFPKTLCVSNMIPNDFLKLLDIKFDLEKNYKTDGFIISLINNTSRFNIDLAKYKPKDELTVDLIKLSSGWYSSDNKSYSVYEMDIPLIGEIWRCYYDNDIWVPREKRTDKSIPNPSSIVDQLNDYHNNYWTATDLVKFNNSYYYDHLIATKNNIDNFASEYLKFQKDSLQSNIYDIYRTFSFTNVLDLGCGKGKLAQIIRSTCTGDIFLDGIDIDCCNIFIASKKYPSKQNRWLVGDINKPLFVIAPYFPINLKDKYDLIVLNCVISYSFNNKHVLIENITRVSSTNTIIYIHFIDFNKIINISNRYIRIKIVDHEKQLVKFNYCWIQSGKAFMEQVFSYNDIDTLFTTYGWFLIKKIDYNGYTHLNPIFNKFVSFHSTLVYKKN